MGEFWKKLQAGIERHPLRSGFAASLILNFLVEVLSRRSLVKPILFLVTRPHIFLYNSCIIFWFFTLLLLVRRKLFGGIVVSVVWLILGFVNFVLLGCRVTPFNGADLRLTKDALVIAGKYLTWWHLVLIGAAAVGLIIALAVLFRKLPKWPRKPIYIKSLTFVVFYLLALLGVFSVGVKTGVLSDQFGNLAQAYLDYGFPLCFSNSLINTGISKPEDYSEEVINDF